MRMSLEEQNRLNELIEICRKYRGEYIPGHHGPGSWATTYSNEFISAAAEMYSIFYKKYNSDLFHSDYINEMSKLFIKSRIRSCRGSTMSAERVEYLYEMHLKAIVNKYL